MTKYTAKFKIKIVLEVLRGENTLNEIVSKYNIIPKNLMNWKKIFLFGPSGVGKTHLATAIAYAVTQ